MGTASLSKGTGGKTSTGTMPKPTGGAKKAVPGRQMRRSRSK